MASTRVDGLLEEYRIVSEGAGLQDRSERGKLALVGSDSVAFLNGQVTNELADLKPSEGRYAAFLTHKGKMLGDLRILALGATDSPAAGASVEALLLDTERVALQALFDMIRRFKVGFRVELEKRTLESGLYTLIGPEARAVAAAALGDYASQLPPELEHSHAGALVAGRPVRLVAGKEGDLDVLFEKDDAALLREALLAAGAHPVSAETGEIVRVERSRPRYGVDMDEQTIPEEAGLNERAVSFTKGCYLGQETVARLHYRGRPNRLLRGLRLDGQASQGEDLAFGERSVGRLASVVDSPRLGPIALALVRREVAPGEILRVGERGLQAEVVELPFAR